MTDLRRKVEHVKASIQFRPHTCHWPGCKKQVAPAYWGCPRHWYSLPQALRNRIWATYQIGQETDGNRPSPEYLAVAREVQEWIKKEGL